MEIDWDPKRREAFDSLDLQLETMLNEWDPLGVYGVSIKLEDGSDLSWPEDEYDDLVRPIRIALQRGCSPIELELALDALLEADYGIAAPPSIAFFVERLIAWWKQLETV